MTGRIFLANVGANASHRFASPIFPDGTFEFLPIPETPHIPPPHGVRYRDLRSHYRPTQNLLRYVPNRLWDTATHNDPEFDTFTYGDNCSTTARGASLKQLGPDDFLFFIARMQHWEGGSPTADYGFYLIGFLEIAQDVDILKEVQAEPSGPQLRRFGANAHLRRGASDPVHWDRFWVFGGSQRSQRFRFAVPVTRDLCQRVLRTAAGSHWRWDAGRSDLQVIGSYTRSCRCVIDPSTDEGAARSRAFWDWIAKFNQQ